MAHLTEKEKYRLRKKKEEWMEFQKFVRALENLHTVKSKAQ